MLGGRGNLAAYWWSGSMNVRKGGWWSYRGIILEPRKPILKFAVETSAFTRKVRRIQRANTIFSKLKSLKTNGNLRVEAEEI